MTPKLLLVAISVIALVGNAINADRAIAQAKPPDQSQAKPSDQSQPTRPRVTFFEQEQKFGKDDSLTFGNENFLQSALSGTTMAIEDPAKLRPSGVINFNGGNISSGSSSTAVGTYSVGVTETFSSRNGSITFSSVSPTSALNATGSVNVNGSINGQSLTGNYNYTRISAPIGTIKFGGYYPATQLTNPSQSFVFKFLAQPVQTSSGNFSAPASVSIGIPRDR